MKLARSKEPAESICQGVKKQTVIKSYQQIPSITPGNCSRHSIAGVLFAHPSGHFASTYPFLLGFTFLERILGWSCQTCDQLVFIFPWIMNESSSFLASGWKCLNYSELMKKFCKGRFLPSKGKERKGKVFPSFLSSYESIEFYCRDWERGSLKHGF